MTHLKDVVSRWFGKVPSKKKKHNVSPESTMEGFFASELGVSKIQQAPAKGIFLPWWSLVTAICLAKYTACSKILNKVQIIWKSTLIQKFFSNGAVRSYNSEYISIFFFNSTQCCAKIQLGRELLPSMWYYIFLQSDKNTSKS